MADCQLQRPVAKDTLGHIAKGLWIWPVLANRLCRSPIILIRMALDTGCSRYLFKAWHCHLHPHHHHCLPDHCHGLLPVFPASTVLLTNPLSPECPIDFSNRNPISVTSFLHNLLVTSYCLINAVSFYASLLQPPPPPLPPQDPPEKSLLNKSWFWMVSYLNKI